VCPNCGCPDGVPPSDAIQIAPGATLRERYIVGRALGYGGFGITYAGWDALTERPVAIKEYLPSEFSTRASGDPRVTIYSGDKGEQFTDGLVKFIDEARRLAQFSNMEGIVSIYDSFEENDTAYIIMELLHGETLSERLKQVGTIPVREALDMLIPAIRALEIVHEKGVIHRDIAPDNIFLTDGGGVKLIDFGTARFATTKYSRSLTVMIKPGYSPEEQYRSRGDQGPHTDVYAIGATLYRMITGVTPPDALERRALIESGGRDELQKISSFGAAIDANTENAILNAMNVRIEDRTPDMPALLRELTSGDKVGRRGGAIKKIDLYRWPKWMKIAVPAAAALFIAAGALLASGVLRFGPGAAGGFDVPDGMTRVPSVIGEELEAAERRLSGAGLSSYVTGMDYSRLVPANLILSQDINAGSVVALNSLVNLRMSGGAKTVEVPTFTWMNADEAKKSLEALGFNVIIELEYSQDFPLGAVINQSADGGSLLAEGDAIVLNVSAGPDPDVVIDQAPVSVPDMRGLDYREALARAQAAGIMLSIKSWEYDPAAEKDTVISQSAPAGDIIMSGGALSLVVSLGARELKIADLRFRKVEDAVKLLEGQGINVNIEHEASSTIAAGLVISQSVEPNSTLEPGETVTIVVSGSPSFPMPGVVGRDEADAVALLTDRALSVAVAYGRDETAEDGVVIRQSVAAGAPVNKGDQVLLTVNGAGVSPTPAPQEMVAVPDVTGQTEGAARTALNAAGLRATVNRAYSGSVARDTVISQNPAAGLEAGKNSAVVITVSNGPQQIVVPNVVGLPRSVAESEIKALGLNAGVSESYNDASAAGYVYAQSPPAGSTLGGGGSVALSVSLGPKPVIAPSDLRVSPASAVLAIGETVQITADVTPADAGDKSVNWASDNGGVAAVSQGGLVTARGAGNATITATTNTGAISRTVAISVSAVITGVSVSPETLTLNINETRTLTATVVPANAPDRSVIWSSADASVATVSSTGAVTARAAGVVRITAASGANPALSAACTLTVNSIRPASVNVTPSSVTLNVGATRQLSASVLPANVPDRAVVWTSGNTRVATVSGSGFVTALEPGAATITATSSADNTVRGTCEVTVNRTGVTGVAVAPSAMGLNVGESRTLTATVTPANATDRSVTWSSTNDSVASVSFDGLVVARAPGTATIRATSNDNTARSGACSVTVNAVRYTVTYNANGGAVSPSSETVSAGDSLSLPVPSRSGYVCNGWYSSASGGNKLGDPGQPYWPSRSETLYAQWRQEETIIKISVAGDPPRYIPGRSYYPEGLTVNVHWNSGSVTTVRMGDAGLAFSPADSGPKGPYSELTQKIVVSYNGFTADVIARAASIVRGDLYRGPLKTHYEKRPDEPAEAFDLTGTLINVTYSTGEVITVEPTASSPAQGSPITAAQDVYIMYADPAGQATANDIKFEITFTNAETIDPEEETP